MLECKIKSLDDFLIGHNIVLNQANDVWVHLSDQQFIALRNSAYNPEYEYLGRLSHLLMDMAVPSHAHKDGHGPTLCLYDNEPTDRKSTRLNSSHSAKSRMPSSA